MKVSVYLVKNDFFSFVRKSVAIYVCGVLLLLFAAFWGVYGGIAKAEVADFFETSGSGLYSYLRGEFSLFGMLIAFLLEGVVAVFVPIALSYNDVTVYFSLAIVPIKAYTSLFDIVIIVRCFTLRAIPFMLVFLAMTIVHCLIVVTHTAFVQKSKFRYSFCTGEIMTIAEKSVPFYLAWGAYALLSTLLLCFCGAFM